MNFNFLLCVLLLSEKSYVDAFSFLFGKIFEILIDGQGDVSDMSDDYEAEQSDDFSEESDVESYFDDESSDEFIVRRGSQGKTKSRTLTERFLCGFC